MSPEDHIAVAEELLQLADVQEDNGLAFEASQAVNKAIANALIALAVESGVPHQTTNTAGG